MENTCIAKIRSPKGKKPHPSKPARTRKNPPLYCHRCRRSRQYMWSRASAQCSQCILIFCDRCLLTKQGEDVCEVSKPGLLWVCPKCRKGCGPGCQICCCTCSICCRTKKGIESYGLEVIRKSESLGFNLHDYLIFLETGESKEEIANRTMSVRWIDATGNQPHSWVIHEKNSPSPTSHHKHPAHRESYEKLVREGTKATAEIGSDVKRIGFDRSGSNTESSLKGKDLAGSHDLVDVDTDSKALRDSLAAFSNVQTDIFLMTLLPGAKKVFEENGVSISLSEKGVLLKNAIQARSYGKGIDYQFHPARFIERQQWEQESMKSCVKKLLIGELVDSKTRLRRFFGEVSVMLNQQFTEVELQLESTAKALAKQINAETELR